MRVFWLYFIYVQYYFVGTTESSVVPRVLHEHSNAAGCASGQYALSLYQFISFFLFSYYIYIYMGSCWQAIKMEDLIFSRNIYYLLRRGATFSFSIIFFNLFYKRVRTNMWTDARRYLYREDLWFNGNWRLLHLFPLFLSLSFTLMLLIYLHVTYFHFISFIH